MAKYLWWFIGDPKAPAWVSLVLSAIWALLVWGHYKKYGWNGNTAFVLAMCAVRLGMFVGHGE